jgi:hypothetical protein
LKNNAKNNDVLLPENLLFADALYFASIQKENNEKINKQAFMDYLIKKYPFLNTIVNSKIDSISFAFKKQLL